MTEDTTTPTMTWKLSPAEFEEARVRVAKINARAERRGFTGRIDVAGERVEETRTNRMGFTVTEIFYRVTVTGEPPKYNGWELLAALDFTDAGLIVRTAPGVESIDRTGLAPGKCDHCRTDRQRRKSFVVSNGTRVVQVGSTCLKDFLGWHASIPFLSDDDGDVSDTLGSLGGTGERTFAIESVLAASWAAVKTFGFVRANDWERRSTRDVVSTILAPGRSREDRRLAEELAPVVAESEGMARAVREFILSDAFTGASEYVTNLKVLCGGDTVGWRHLGLLVSAPQAMARAQERTLIRERERAEIVNEFVGNPKDKIDIKVKIKSVRFSGHAHGTTTIYTLVAETGHVFKWYASSSVLGEEATDTYVALRGTVKKHEEWEGRMSTIITRCKLLD